MVIWSDVAPEQAFCHDAYDATGDAQIKIWRNEALCMPPVTDRLCFASGGPTEAEIVHICPGEPAWANARKSGKNG
jgi:hypothetical protein